MVNVHARILSSLGTVGLLLVTFGVNPVQADPIEDTIQCISELIQPEPNDAPTPIIPCVPNPPEQCPDPALQVNPWEVCGINCNSLNGPDLCEYEPCPDPALSTDPLIVCGLSCDNPDICNPCPTPVYEPDPMAICGVPLGGTQECPPGEVGIVVDGSEICLDPNNLDLIPAVIDGPIFIPANAICEEDLLLGYQACVWGSIVCHPEAGNPLVWHGYEYAAAWAWGPQLPGSLYATEVEGNHAVADADQALHDIAYAESSTEWGDDTIYGDVMRVTADATSFLAGMPMAHASGFGTKSCVS